jgi:hypothetical protein
MFKLKGYKTSLTHLQNYIKARYKKADLDIERLDYSFIRDYDYYLKMEAKCIHVTVAKI